MKTLKDQLTIVIRNQLDFQQKIENQMCTLQTMMQTICQLVNSEIISRRTSVTPAVAPPPAPDRYSYHASKVPVVPKTTNTAMDELLTFAQRMNNGVATSHPAAKRPMSAVTTNSESQSYETVKPLPIRRTAESESTRLSPLENHFFDTTSPSTVRNARLATRHSPFRFVLEGNVAGENPSGTSASRPTHGRIQRTHR